MHFPTALFVAALAFASVASATPVKRHPEPMPCEDLSALPIVNLLDTFDNFHSDPTNAHRAARIVRSEGKIGVDAQTKALYEVNFAGGQAAKFKVQRCNATYVDLSPDTLNGGDVPVRIVSADYPGQCVGAQNIYDAGARSRLYLQPCEDAFLVLPTSQIWARTGDANTLAFGPTPHTDTYWTSYTGSTTQYPTVYNGQCGDDDYNCKENRVHWNTVEVNSD